MLEEIFDKVKPGDIVAFDFAITTQNQTLQNTAISKIKAKVHDHPMLDYQSSKVSDLYDTQAGQNVKMLRVFAQVRETEKGTRVKVQEASAASLAAWIVAGLAGIGAYAVLQMVTKSAGATSGYGATAGSSGGLLGDLKDIGFLAVIGLVLLIFLRK